ncbi:hypothetical protein SDRG_06351 [Saprolegnia diclina VS20]|uniref:Phospholipid-transporting ATPase n=1 Tax=Saprolegnia diclina (strain VS20) TaxID=1156394 RepID=T0QEB4_SAPDV|nr:hypothetical protein SDRG_06351 [Saprolegnia diclina VS20]EQC36244.1 hypothetical protein SDRG_06351 [Saprolegnia diclina VS20]|eukprot:XP_008610350.1 hypothetical protein SDRG_06351 [Saprolegnia diclina VS20]
MAAIETEYRHVYIADALRNAALGHASNYVRTAKYSSWSFLPLFLFESFQKVGNGYFLLVAVLQCIRAISNTNGVPATLPTLTFILCVDATFAILEDLKRRRADRIANGRATRKLAAHGAFVEVLWADIRVGDILEIRNHEPIPADVLLLSVPNDVGSSTCYVETKSLDGETNLKQRQAVPTTQHATTPSTLSALRGHATVERPNHSIHTFQGVLHVVHASDTTPAALSTSNMLLRGSTLQSTARVYGLVITAGMETKSIKGNRPTPSKRSALERRINLYVLALVGLLVVFCTGAATASVLWTSSAQSAHYLGPELRASWVVTFFYYFLLMYQFVPISLYVSMGTAKFAQARFIEWDLGMYHASSNTPAAVRSMGLNEDLGQISHLVTDKTGTLTSNIMQFRKCSIKGVACGARCDRPKPIKRNSTKVHVPMSSPAFDESALVELTNIAHSPDGRRFFILLAVCHTVLQDEDGAYSAASSDELALVLGAKAVGVVFTSRSPTTISITVHGNELTFDILAVLEFDSNRRRMSIVLRDIANDVIVVYTKGADVNVASVLRRPLSESAVTMRADTMRHVQDYAGEGLRTLLCAYKVVDEAWYLGWAERYAAAAQSLPDVDRRQKGLPNAIDKCFAEMEADLELLGATAIEDKLQDGVGETLQALRAAGINLWMLTGDKEETAINIGRATHLILPEMRCLAVSEASATSAALALAELTALRAQLEARGAITIARPTRPPPGRRRTTSATSVTDWSKSRWTLTASRISIRAPSVVAETGHALIVTGAILDHVFSNGACSDMFGAVAERCSTVIACRVSPAQKASLVRLLMRLDPTSRVLAIGDGANDVPMLQEAHVGVGISGQEGLQAVNASDYAIAQFSYLRNLLLVHGRSNYERISKLVLYILYKNILLITAQFWFALFTGFSGQKLYLEVGVQLYNVAFTSLPIVLLAVLDADLPRELVLQLPFLYKAGPNHFHLNHGRFAIAIGSALLESLCLTSCAVAALEKSDVHGASPGLWLLGMVVLTSVIVLANLKLVWWQHAILPANALAYISSIGLWGVIAVLCSEWFFLSGFAWERMMDVGTSLPAVWLTWLLVVVTLLLSTTVALRAFATMVHPTCSDIVKEIQAFRAPNADVGPLVQGLVNSVKAVPATDSKSPARLAPNPSLLTIHDNSGSSRAILHRQDDQA